MKKDMDILEEKLLQTDFSLEGNKEQIKRDLMSNLSDNNLTTEGIDNNMKFERRFKPKNIAAASLVCILGLTAVTYGSDMIQSFRSFALSENVSFVVEQEWDESLLEALHQEYLESLNHIYDAEGNKLSEKPKNGSWYDADGNKLGTIQVVTRTINPTVLNNFDEVKALSNSNFLVPTVLPEGFYLDGIYVSNFDNDNTLIEEYDKLDFRLLDDNGNEIYVRANVISDESSIIGSVTNNVKEVSINGHQGLLDGNILVVKIDGILYDFSASTPDVAGEVLIDLAKSLS